MATAVERKLQLGKVKEAADLLNVLRHPREMMAPGVCEHHWSAITKDIITSAAELIRAGLQAQFEGKALPDNINHRFTDFPLERSGWLNLVQGNVNSKIYFPSSVYENALREKSSDIEIPTINEVRETHREGRNNVVYKAKFDGSNLRFVIKYIDDNLTEAKIYVLNPREMDFLG